jgi:hypothetical protein
MKCQELKNLAAVVGWLASSDQTMAILSIIAFEAV